MRDIDAIRLVSAGLHVPGVSESDHEELIKAARQLRSVWPEYGRGQYLSEFGGDWAFWQGGGHDKKPTTTVAFTTLRDRFRNSPIDKAIVNRRQMQVRRVAQRCLVPGKQVGFRVVHERHADPSFIPSPDTIERCNAMERLICNVARDVVRDVKQFSSMMIKEELIIDRKAVIRFLDDDTGLPVGYAPLDGATVLPRIAVLLPFMTKTGIMDTDKAAEQLSQELRVANIKDSKGDEIDVTKAAWIQVVNEEIRGAWTKDEMYVDVVNKDIEIDQILYGKSCLEQSLELTDLFISAFMYNLQLFTPNFPEGFISVIGAYDKAGIEAFKRTMLMQSNVAGVSRVPVIPADDDKFKMEYVKLRDTPKDALFAELLRIVIAFKTACYGMHPSEINFSPDGGGQTAVINEEDEGAAQEKATEDGFYSVLDNLAGMWTDSLIRPYFDDLQVIWEGLSNDNEAGRVDLNKQKLEAYATLGEIRGTENAYQLIIPDDLSKADLTKLPLNPTLVSWAQLKQNAQQMEQQMAQQQQQMPEPPQNGHYGQEDKDWHKAGQEPEQDTGQEPPNWEMMGQTDNQGQPIEMQGGQAPAPVGAPAQKSFRASDKNTMKYIRLVLDDDEG